MVNISFELLTKAQHAVMDALCNSPMTADSFKPATLGSLCGMGLVDVVSGQASSTCIITWNLAFHPDRYADISEDCMVEIKYLINAGRRIAAVKVLRTHTDLDLKNAVGWMNYHFPKP
jgi:hypothetical protein